MVAVLPPAAHALTQWNLGLNLTSRYDTNIELTEKAQSDMVYIAGSQVGMNYQGADVDLAGNYNLGVELFGTHHDLNHAAQSLNMSGNLSRMLAHGLPNQSTLTFSESIVYAPNLPLFSSNALNQTSTGTSLVQGVPTVDVSTSGVGTPRTTTFRQAFSLSGNTPLSPLTRLNLTYSNNYTHYQDPSLVDSWTNGFLIGLRHDVSRTDTLTGDASYTRFNPYGGGISHAYSLTGGDQHSFSPVFTGSAAVGVGAVVYPNQIQNQNQTQYTMNGNLSVSRQISETLQVSLWVSRNFGTGSGISRIPLVQNVGTVTLNQQFTQFLQMHVALNAARNYSLGGAASKTNVLSRAVDVGLNYQITAWLESELDYSYYRQDSFEPNQPDLSRNLYSFALRARWS